MQPILRGLYLFALLSVLGTGCAYVPPETVSTDFLTRAETQNDGEIEVSALVLSPEESDQVFGTSLTKRAIQPIWVEIRNDRTDTLFLLVIGLDPDYFSPAEAAWKTKGFGETGINRKIGYFYQKQAPILIPPGETISGYVYTNFDPGGKAFAVELLTEDPDDGVKRFEFFQSVPGFEADFSRVDFDQLYAPEEVKDLDLEELRTYLETLPCCALGGDQKTPGDPLNLVIVGEGLHMLASLVGRGWDLTETVKFSTAWKTVMSSLFKSQYRTSPVSPLYLFDRPQDLALQKSRNSVDERNHLRLWLAPVTFEGEPVWVGQISRDIGVRFSSVTFVTHKIDPVVDEARLYITMDLAVSQFLRSLGYVEGVGYASVREPGFNYTKDPYYTDGLRIVLFMSKDPVPITRVELMDWVIPDYESGILDAESPP